MLIDTPAIFVTGAAIMDAGVYLAAELTAKSLTSMAVRVFPFLDSAAELL